MLSIQDQSNRYGAINRIKITGFGQESVFVKNSKGSKYYLIKTIFDPKDYFLVSLFPFEEDGGFRVGNEIVLTHCPNKFDEPCLDYPGPANTVTRMFVSKSGAFEIHEVVDNKLKSKKNKAPFS